MRLIDADALMEEVMDRHCNDCERRKGVKNGKWKIVYSIGDAPCRACGIGDMIDYLEDAPTIEPERKKGKWIPHPNKELREWDVCTACGTGCKRREYGTNPDGTEYITEFSYLYCPNCGVVMERES